MTIAQDLAEAFVKVAEADHYMVNVAYEYTVEELMDAQQILIARDNKSNNSDETLSLALDLMEYAQSRMLDRMSRGQSAHA